MVMRSDGMFESNFPELLPGVKDGSALNFIPGSEAMRMTSHGNIAVLVGLLVCTAAAAMAEVPPTNTPAARQEAKHLDEMPAVVGSTHLGGSRRGARPITASILPTGRWLTENA
jgi:hypothetical protein